MQCKFRIFNFGSGTWNTSSRAMTPCMPAIQLKLNPTSKTTYQSIRAISKQQQRLNIRKRIMGRTTRLEERKGGTAAAQTVNQAKRSPYAQQVKHRNRS